MYFYLDPNIDLHNREYMKIQILAANVGGIIKIFFDGSNSISNIV